MHGFLWKLIGIVVVIGAIWLFGYACGVGSVKDGGDGHDGQQVEQTVSPSATGDGQ
ncbi:hypothetical protein [Brachybacterium sp. NPDC056505]|jgi:hypothetical protein|uniref:hypothetical protein n=1 Tax=Brachybacterium sp. NPDC056505 TaxID=3345843 RepID=UPI00366CF2DD